VPWREGGRRECSRPGFQARGATPRWIPSGSSRRLRKHATISRQASHRLPVPRGCRTMPPAWPESPATPAPSGHPTRDDLEGFLTGALGKPERPRILRHLLAGCAECAALCRPILAGLDPRFAPPVDESAYDAPLDRVRARFAARAGIETRAEVETRARQDLVTLFALPDELSPLRPRRPAPSREYQLAWIATLIEGAKSLRGDEPHTCAYLANAALC